LGRKICESCGFIIPYTPQNDLLTLCERCGGKLIRRSDDTPGTVEKRMREQGNEAVAPVREYYHSRGVLHIIDGTTEISEVEKEVATAIQ
jgi:adenylate kinase